MAITDRILAEPRRAAPYPLRSAFPLYRIGPPAVVAPRPLRPTAPAVETSAARSGLAALALARSGYRRATWLVLAAFVALEAGIIFLAANGPFTDEGIYITAGLRTLQGHGFGDNYMTWLFGSLLWPVMAGMGSIALGLAGARLLALLCVTLAVLGSVQAARNIFGDRAGFWSAAAFVASGPTLALAHLAVYDAPALAGIGLAFWAITAFTRRDNRIWLVIAALLFCGAVVAKYNILLCGLPLVGVIIAGRGRKAPIDVAMFGYVSAAVLLSFYLPFRSQLVALLHWRMRNNPTFGATHGMVLVTVVELTLLPLLLALAGWLAAGRRRGMATVLLGALFLWPAFHLATWNSVSFDKHVVFGYLFAYPLVGLALARLSAARRPAGMAIVLAGIVLLGYQQMSQMDRAWSDVRPVARYLVAHVRPGQRLLTDNGWPYVYYLYTRHRIATPWAVYDVSRAQSLPGGAALCAATWFVDESDTAGLSNALRARVAACHTFVRVFSYRSMVTNVGPSLSEVTYPVYTVVWRNVGHAPARRALGVAA